MWIQILAWYSPSPWKGIFLFDQIALNLDVHWHVVELLGEVKVWWVFEQTQYIVNKAKIKLDWIPKDEWK